LHPESQTDGKILVTGANGMLGRALCARLAVAGNTNLLTPSRNDLDLLDAASVAIYILQHRPDYVFHLGAMVYGLGGNTKFKLQSLVTNTMINHNVLTACAAAKPRKIFFAGSVASYPYPYKSLPLNEKDFTGAAPHYGEYGYSQAKMHALSYLTIMKRELGIDYAYGILTNLYGPHDRFDTENGHVIPSLICKIHAAATTGRKFRVWGDGTATRDFMHAEDAAEAILLATGQHNGIINICSGHTTTLRSVVEDLKVASGWFGEVIWEKDKPTGIPQRSVSNRELERLNFKARYTLSTGLKQTYDWYAAKGESSR
jgi:GDP-L-fucose synthase